MCRGGPDMSCFTNPFDLFTAITPASADAAALAVLAAGGCPSGGMGVHTGAVQGKDEKSNIINNDVFQQCLFGCRCAASRCMPLFDCCLKEHAGWP